MRGDSTDSQLTNVDPIQSLQIDSLFQTLGGSLCRAVIRGSLCSRVWLIWCRSGEADWERIPSLRDH